MTVEGSIKEVFVSVRGVRRPERALEWGGATILAPRRRWGVAMLLDEDYLDGPLVEVGALREALRGLENPPMALRCSSLAHLDTASGDGAVEWDNRSCLTLSQPQSWVKKQVAKDVREGLRRARREGVEVREIPFDEESFEAIATLFNETPIRQGKRYWHYGKSARQIGEELSPLAGRSVFVGAFLGARLVGFSQIVRLERLRILRTVHVLGSVQAKRVRPVSAMIEWMVQYGWEQGFERLVYGKHNYGGSPNDTLAAFKSRHGFRLTPLRVDYHPLSPWGAWFLAAGLHRSPREMIPAELVHTLKGWRARWARGR